MLFPEAMRTHEDAERRAFGAGYYADERMRRVQDTKLITTMRILFLELLCIEFMFFS